MRLADIDKLKAERNMADDCAKCKHDAGICAEHQCYSRMDICNMLDDVPTVAAIPVEWLEKRRQNLILAAMVHSTVYGDNSVELCHAVNVVLEMWQKEQEAR